MDINKIINEVIKETFEEDNKTIVESKVEDKKESKNKLKIAAGAAAGAAGAGLAAKGLSDYGKENISFTDTGYQIFKKLKKRNDNTITPTKIGRGIEKIGANIKDSFTENIAITSSLSAGLGAKLIVEQFRKLNK